MKIIATKARRHQGFIFNKTFCLTLCLSGLVAIFMADQGTFWSKKSLQKQPIVFYN
jgi:hypothetical protein